MTLNRAVMTYDDAVVSADAKQLLVNIARAQHHQPIHFTRVSNIAATFDFSVNAGATPALTGDAGGRLLPFFGGSVSENPTFSIVPIQGEEFMRRLLTPFHQDKFTLLLRQHFDVDLMLRMMAQEVRLQHSEQPAILPDNQDAEEQGRRQRFRQGLHNIELTEEPKDRARLRQQRHRYQATYHNSPSDRTGYEMFRRVVLHLSAIQDQKQLYVEPVTFKRSWTIPASAISGESFQSLEKGFTVHYNQLDDTYTLSKKISGPVLITNYDPNMLCCEERTNAEDLITPWLENDVAFDIRPSYPGGEWPIRGAFRLRSFHSILNFLSHLLGEEPEYHVAKDPRTPPIYKDENPINTLELVISDTPPSTTMLSAYSHGRYYAVSTTGANAHWNMNAFQLLYILFRMTVTDVTPLGVPSITIAK